MVILMILYKFFFYFITYSIIGCLIEIVKLSIEHKRFVKRGFLIGPWCPIYGCGYIFIHFISYFKNNLLLILIISFLGLGILEYIVSFLLEKLFHARWWDYSDKKMNLNGRICFSYLVLFSLFSILAIYILNPYLSTLFEYIPKKILLLLVCLFILDVIVSISIISKLKLRKLKNKDNTEEISEKVKDVLVDN